MKLSRDERRALAFIAFVILLATGVRVAGRPEVASTDLAPVDLAAFAEENREALAEAERRSRPLAPGETIDPNTADAGELQRLPGIGPALAARIVADREARGPFRSAADLLRVSGIGEATLGRLAPHLALPASTPGVAGARTSAGDAGMPGAGGPADLVDVNTASVAELQRLPGIGPALAGRIVAHRDTAGPFRTMDDLERVPGIGPATLARIAPYVRLAP